MSNEKLKPVSRWETVLPGRGRSSCLVFSFRWFILVFIILYYSQTPFLNNVSKNNATHMLHDKSADWSLCTRWLASLLSSHSWYYCDIVLWHGDLVLPAAYEDKLMKVHGTLGSGEASHYCHRDEVCSGDKNSYLRHKMFSLLLLIYHEIYHK